MIPRKQKQLGRLNLKKAAEVGAIAVGTAVAAYGAYKVTKVVREKNRQIRVGQALAEANGLLDLNKSNFNIKGKGLTNDQVATVNKQFNAYAKTLLDRAVGTGNHNAREDSFATAVRNVYGEYRRRR